MAYSAGSAATTPALFAALETFASANGWTIDESDTVSGWPRYHKGNCYVGFRYDGTSPPAAGRTMGVYQAGGFTGGTVRPGGDPDDSGNGIDDQITTIPDTTLDNSRCIHEMGDGPFNYWFFEHDDGTIFYIHVVLEVRPTEYKHLGFGLITKYGDWGAGASGGEYCYAQMDEFGAISQTGSWFFDGGNATVNSYTVTGGATMRMIGLPGQQPSNWGAFWQNAGTAPIVFNKDRAGNFRSRLIGQARGGTFWRAKGWFRGYPGFSGIIPMTAMAVTYLDLTNQRSYMLGEMPDVRLCNIAQFDAQEEVSIGADTWVFFPFLKKGTITGTTDSGYYGVAYRKETT